MIKSYIGGKVLCNSGKRDGGSDRGDCVGVVVMIIVIYLREERDGFILVW